MNKNNSLEGIVSGKVSIPLDSGFMPLVKVWRQFQQAAESCVGKESFSLALAQPAGAVSRRDGYLFPEGHPRAGENLGHVERLTKFMLWAYGGRKIYFCGPRSVADGLKRHYTESATGKFDNELIGRKIYDGDLEVLHVAAGDVPGACLPAKRIGGQWNGCRIGFDLGGSDRKASAVMDGKVLFTEEIGWQPYFEKNPEYHYQGIMDSLKRAAKHLPRVDAIGGSAAGVYVENQVRVASLFRGVSPADFDQHVKDLFFRIKKEWGNIPLVVMNDGEVTALAGAAALKDNAVLGVSMGTSEAAGFVTPDGSLTPWLNELAFAPIDGRLDAPADEWSGDRGCGVQYFSQQAMPRLAKAAGIDLPDSMPLPEKLVAVQELMAGNDPRARLIYETIGAWFGYAVLQYREFYPLRNVLVLGRVTSGTGGEIILDRARHVIGIEAPELAGSIKLMMPGETDKRHGQAVVAASLPVVEK